MEQYVDRAALFDELVKIGEVAEQKLEEPAQPAKKSWSGWPVLRGMAAGGIGIGAGYGASTLVEHAFPKAMREVTPGKLKAMKIILPILGGSAFILGDRYRRLMDKSHAQAESFQPPK